MLTSYCSQALVQLYAQHAHIQLADQAVQLRIVDRHGRIDWILQINIGLAHEQLLMLEQRRQGADSWDTGLH